MGRLDVRVVQARGITNAAVGAANNKLSAFCILKVETNEFRTSTVEGGANPEWNEVFKFSVQQPQTAQLCLEVWDHSSSSVKDTLVGSLRFPLAECSCGVVRDEWFPLQQQCDPVDRKAVPGVRSAGDIRLRLLAHDFGRDMGADVARQRSTSFVANAPLFPSSSPAVTSPSYGSQPSGYPALAATVPVVPQPVNPMPMYGPPQPNYAAIINQLHPQAPNRQAPPPGILPYEQVGYGRTRSYSQPAPPQQPPLGYSSTPYGLPGAAADPLGLGYPSSASATSSGYWGSSSAALPPEIPLSSASGTFRPDEPVTGVPLGFAPGAVMSTPPPPFSNQPQPPLPPAPRPHGGCTA